MTSLNRDASSSNILNGEDREGHLEGSQDGSTDYVAMEENLPCGGTLGIPGPDEGTSGRPERRLKKYVKFATSIKTRNSTQ